MIERFKRLHTLSTLLDVNVTQHPFFDAAVNARVGRVLVANPEVGPKLVRIERLGLVLTTSLEEHLLHDPRPP